MIWLVSLEKAVPKFKFIHTQVHRVDRIYSEEFDTDDQSQWDEVKAKAQDMMGADEFAALPDDAPDDIDIWLSVYSVIDPSELSDEEEDWVTDRKGGVESYFEVTDEDDNVVAEG
jgi:hypothetical protein